MDLFSPLLNVFKSDNYAAEVKRFKIGLQNNPNDLGLRAEYAKFCLRHYFAHPDDHPPLEVVDEFDKIDHSQLFDPEFYYLMGRYCQGTDDQKATRFYLDGITRFNHYIEKNPALKQDYKEIALATALNYMALQPNSNHPELGKFFKSTRKSQSLLTKRVELESEIEKSGSDSERVQELSQEMDQLKVEREVERSMALLYSQSGEWDKVIEECEKLQKAHPYDPHLYNMMGDAYAKKKEDKNAFEAYLEARELYGKLKNTQRVAHIDGKIAELAPEGMDAKQGKRFRSIVKMQEGNRLVAEGKLEEALEYYNQLIASDPSNISYRERLGDLYLENNMVEEGVSQIKAIADMHLSDGQLEAAKSSREKEAIKTAFSKYVTKSVMDRILLHPDGLRLGGEKKVITTFFSDIRGFTHMSEVTKAEDVVQLLNEYFTAMTSIIFKYEGTLDKFMGDAIMAVFGAPIDIPDHAERAVRTAIEMNVKMRELQAKWAMEGKGELNIGIGINTGEVIVGNIGSNERMEYTAIGDNVNLTQRLESVAEKGEILISAATYESVKNKVDATMLDPIKVKGKAEKVIVYRIEGLKKA